ncbi:MAG: hypothetical protein VKL42_16435 [Snowella sp.]|nr:hypothetical protein [Snowella sp.]
MNIFILIALAKANDYLNQAWPLATVYMVILLVEKLMPSLKPPNYPDIIIHVILSFGVAGLFFMLLNRFQDSIFIWLLILMLGTALLTYMS